MQGETLYQAILARQSVRRYDREPLDAGTLSRLREVVDGVRPLDPAVPVETVWRDVTSPQDLAIVGPYGRIVSPPHILAPYAVGGREALVELGYRTEQISVRMAGMGIGSCYLGALPREAEVRAHLGLPERARIAAWLIYGRPAAGWGGRTLNALIHQVVGAASKMPVERFFYRDELDAPSPAPKRLAPLLEAARAAPSAVNAQPWRFLWRGGALYLFVERDSARYGGGSRAHYRYHDGGACMANVSLAMEALGRSGRWALFAEDAPDLPEHPPELEPLALLTLED